MNFSILSMLMFILRNEARNIINHRSIIKRSVTAVHSRFLTGPKPRQKIFFNGGYYCSDNQSDKDRIDCLPEEEPFDHLHLKYSKYHTQLNSTASEVQLLSERYPNKFECISIPHLPDCEIYLCGTLHVADGSVNMVKDVIQSLKPQYVMLELCDGRIDGLLEDEQLHDLPPELLNITFFQVIRNSLKDRSIKSLGIGLLTWMQIKAAKMVGSKLGGEQSAACRAAYSVGSMVVLGDRSYQVTIQRIFDALSLFEKVKMILVISWEIFTMSIFKLKDYIQKTENDHTFIQDELDRFAKYLPAFAHVVITERDEYLAQSLYEIATVPFTLKSSFHNPSKRRIVAVIGAGHLSGVKSNLLKTPILEERLREISSSSKQSSTWPGKGVLQVLDLRQRYDNFENVIKKD